MMMSPKKYVDGVKDNLTPFIGPTKFASLVMQKNQPVGGSFQVISSEQTIQPNRPAVAS
jgi:hypothetical protein